MINQSRIKSGSILLLIGAGLIAISLFEGQLFGFWLVGVLLVLIGMFVGISCIIDNDFMTIGIGLLTFGVAIYKDLLNTLVLYYYQLISGYDTNLVMLPIPSGGGMISQYMSTIMFKPGFYIFVIAVVFIVAGIFIRHITIKNRSRPVYKEMDML